MMKKKRKKKKRKKKEEEKEEEDSDRDFSDGPIQTDVQNDTNKQTYR